ncbi:reverse transcriptase domain-containing protein [Tanacetum coccineum]
MADNRIMAQLLEAPTEGYEDAIVVPEITANNFEIKHGLLNLVQNKQFFGHDKEDPHAHIRYFNKITSTMKFSNVPNTSQVSSDVVSSKRLVSALILNKKTPAPAPIKAVEQSCYDDKYRHNTKNLKDEDKTALIKVLKSHKHAIAWKIFDIKGIDPQFCSHKILMEEHAQPVVQHQRRVNPKIHEVIKQEVIKLLDAGLIYPISDSPWIPIDPLDQEKTTFTCPYRTFSYRRMPFGLCNAPSTFQRCMVAIFHDMIEKTMEVFMDDFSVFGDSFSSCLSHLDKMLQRCEDTNLVLNWEKCHFMVKEGIDFSKIARPMTHLLEKETPFIFSKECIKAFETLKMKLTQAPILVAPDWDLPFEKPE